MARPAFRGGAAHVRVPATSANLGPGFDSLGLALELHDDVVAVIGEDGVLVDVAGEGADEVPRTEKNLVVSSMRATFDELGGQPRGIEVSCANRIPHGRGLGSSAAAITAGVLLARALVLGGEQALPMPAVLDLASRLEGHPDNVAACLLGGLTVAWDASNDAGAHVNAIRVNLDASISPFVFIPPTRHRRGPAARPCRRPSRTATPPTTPGGRPCWSPPSAVPPTPSAMTSTRRTRWSRPRRPMCCSPPPTTACISSTAAPGWWRPRTWSPRCVRPGSPPWSRAPARPCSPSPAPPADVEAAAAAVPKGWSGGLYSVDPVGAHLVPVQRSSRVRGRRGRHAGRPMLPGPIGGSTL